MQISFGESIVHTFQNYNINVIVYNFIKGENRYIKELYRAQILVRYNIHFNKDWKGKFKSFFGVHTYHPQKEIGRTPYFSEKELAKIIKTIYFSNKPRFGLYNNFLYKYIKDNTLFGTPKTKISETFYNKIYNKLNSETRDDERIELYLNLRGEVFELFNNHFLDLESGETFSIRCFSSPFQISMVKQSKIIGIDCTFQIGPHQYKQVMVFVGKKDRINIYYCQIKRKALIRRRFQHINFLSSVF